MPRKPVTPRFFRRDPLIVARSLLGCRLDTGGRSGMIVETEAYLGPEDKASHARFGAGGRSAPMWMDGGTIYVYLCYGVHEMFNLVAGPENQPGAVLVRAAQPLDGCDSPRVAAGPGKLTKYFGIDRRLNKQDIVSSPTIYLSRDIPSARLDIKSGPRIGVAYAKSWAKRHYRFWIRDNPSVSRL